MPPAALTGRVAERLADHGWYLKKLKKERVGGQRLRILPRMGAAQRRRGAGPRRAWRLGVPRPRPAMGVRQPRCGMGRPDSDMAEAREPDSAAREVRQDSGVDRDLRRGRGDGHGQCTSPVRGVRWVGGSGRWGRYFRLFVRQDGALLLPFNRSHPPTILTPDVVSKPKAFPSTDPIKAAVSLRTTGGWLGRGTLKLRGNGVDALRTWLGV